MRNCSAIRAAFWGTTCELFRDGDGVSVSAMWKNRWPIALVVLCLHCAGATKSSPPQESPGEPSGEGGAPSAEHASSAEAAASSEAPAASAESKAPPAKKTCAQLKKGDCKVTVGCGWSDKTRKCVEENAGE